MASVTLVDQSISIFCIILCGLTCYIPLYLKTLLDKGILAVMIMFGGGIFLGLAFNHTIPETYLGFDAEKEELFPTLNIPYAPLTIAAGYFMLVLLDLTASNFSDYHKNPVDIQNDIFIKDKLPDAKDDTANNNTNHLANAEKGELKSEEKEQLNEENSLVAPLILTVSLILHVMIESLTIGLQEDQNEIYALLFGICTHKIFTSLSLGLTYIKNELSTTLIYTLLLAYTLSAPVGVIIGIIIKEEANHLVHLIFSGIASGTFLYIGINEVLVKGLGPGNSRTNKNYNLLSYFMGYLVIVLILYLIHMYGGEHEHEEEHHH